MGNVVADTHFEMDDFFSALGQIPNIYPRKDMEPENPYTRAALQANRELFALADKWQQKLANDKMAAREAALARWRIKVKAGDEGWVGPVSFGQFAGDLMMHGLVVDRRGELIRIQYDGTTNHNMAVSLDEKESWVKIKTFYPESEFKAGNALSVFQPNAMPMVR